MHWLPSVTKFVIVKPVKDMLLLGGSENVPKHFSSHNFHCS